jgi:DNA-binding MarR family transcriptional regulator
MNGVDLFLLGRSLMRIGEAAIPTEGLPEYSTSVRTVVIVLSDVVEHPGSAVGEIAARTGFPQSAVSGSVARLREAGAVVTEPDPADRRRLLVRQNPVASARVRALAATSIDDALGAALADADAVAEVHAALETLARHLTPHRVRDAAPPR